jgi:carbon monoxide dehydrogenase subunit G
MTARVDFAFEHDLVSWTGGLRVVVAMNQFQHQRRTFAWWAGCVFAALAGLLCAFALGSAPVDASESREFSSQEQALLRAGKLVVRAEQRSIGTQRLLGGMSWQVVDATPARVWRALSDARTYSHFLPAVEEARLIESIGTNQLLFIRHRLGFVTASYSVRAHYDAAQGRVRFHMDRERASSIRDAWGELRVTPYAGQKSVVSLAIMADLGEGLVVGLVRSNVHEWMMRVPEQLKRFIESRRG